jgi:DNA-binding Lrp family transcriptional regulator
MNTTRSILFAARFLAVALIVTASAVAQSPPTTGPTHILSAYRSEPANRPAFRTYLQRDMLARLEKLKREGVLSGYQILFNPFTTAYTWDAMTILRFANYADTLRWVQIERTTPGGLNAAGLRLAKPIDTYSADLPWEGQADDPGPEKDGVYYVIPYEYSAADQYRKYVDAYVIPQVTGWMREGVLGSYRIYMNRYPVGRPWDSLFVFRYRNLEAFGRREEIIAKVRKTLVDQPVWKQFSDIKQTIRTESENTIAEALQPRDGPQ